MRLLQGGQGGLPGWGLEAGRSLRAAGWLRPAELGRPSAGGRFLGGLEVARYVMAGSDWGSVSTWPAGPADGAGREQLPAAG